jgi:hypothetical protein
MKYWHYPKTYLKEDLSYLGKIINMIQKLRNTLFQLLYGFYISLHLVFLHLKLNGGIFTLESILSLL